VSVPAGIHYLDARAPDGMRLYAVGDIHGRRDLLTAMHAHIMDEILRDRPSDWRIIYVGDYGDRGPDTRGVMEFLSRTCAAEERVIALAGNHDVDFLDFLDELDVDGMFANNGGFETGLSYGVRIDLVSQERAAPGHAALIEAMPGHHLAFLRGLELTATFGDFFFCHAGIRPGVPLDAQEPHDLLWIRGPFHRHTGLYPKVIVHGHTPVGEAEIMPNRVNLDTGAWFSGRLTALAVDGDRKRLLEVRG
jgi:serine/threonine protein phosphatase 1